MKRIIVKPEELVAALLVWLRVAPRRIWRKSEIQARLECEKRHDPESAPDSRRELAEFVAGQFEAAGWEVSRDEPKNHG